MNDDKAISESKKATMFLIVLVVSVIVFTVGTVWHADVVAFLSKIWDGLMFYLGAQGGQDITARLAQARTPQPPTPQTTDRYADK